jgi:hypothetical protein
LKWLSALDLEAQLPGPQVLQQRPVGGDQVDQQTADA